MRFLKATGLIKKTFLKKLHNRLLIEVCPQEHIQRQLFWYGFYEKESILTWELFMNKDKVVCDIGANTGYYSLVAAPLCRQVYSFEPSGSNREGLKKNIALNGCKNISVQSYALSDTAGQSVFYDSANDNSGMSGLTKPGNYSGINETVSTITLDEWMSKHSVGHVDMIKADVEGAEMLLLTGMKETLIQSRPVIFMEICNELLNKFGHRDADIFEFLNNHNYSGYEILEPGILKQVVEPVESDHLVFLPAGYILPGKISIA